MRITYGLGLVIRVCRFAYPRPKFCRSRMPNTVMQAILARIQNISGSVLALSLFAGAFLLGLAIFALSQSLVIAAATMGLVSLSGALATREWLSKRDAAQTQDAIHSEFRQQARRVNALSDRIIELENELRVARPNHRHVDRIQLERLSKEFESVITIVGQLVKIVDAQESRFIKYDARFAKTISANPKHSETRLSPPPACRHAIRRYSACAEWICAALAT